jgi:hypothetical protein
MGAACHDRLQRNRRESSHASGRPGTIDRRHRIDMTASDQPTAIGSVFPASSGPVAAASGRSLLWLGLALIVAALLLVALGEGGPRVAGPPTVTVGTAAYHGDAA